MDGREVFLGNINLCKKLVEISNLCPLFHKFTICIKIDRFNPKSLQLSLTLLLLFLKSEFLWKSLSFFFTHHDQSSPPQLLSVELFSFHI